MSAPQPETDDQRAQRLLRIAMDVAVRIREEPADAVAKEFNGLDYGELRDLALLASACIDVSRHVSDVVWWVTLDQAPVKRRVKPQDRNGLRPCGTRAAYNRHLARGEMLDLACELSYRRDESERKARSRNGHVPVHRLPTDAATAASDRPARLAA